MISSAEYEYLLSIAAVHDRAACMWQYALENKTHFDINLDKLAHIVQLTLQITRANYPRGDIPLHSRWRHFAIAGKNHVEFLHALPVLERAKAQLDLAMISVLLDAGAGAAWSYRDKTGQRFARSEGLAIASVELFAAGAFSADKRQPWRVDAEALLQLSLDALAQGLQVNEHNPMLGLPGRLSLLQNLGKILIENTAVFPGARPAGLYDYLRATFGASMTAGELVHVLLSHLNAIWPGRIENGYALGDIWEYAPLGWIPLHKLTLWLTLSLIEPLQAAQMTIHGLEQLPGLAEYRNGGLFIDGEVLVIKDRELLTQQHQPADALIVEWRALTLALLEKLAVLVRQELGVNARALPLVNILQGGTWQAGRQLALHRSVAGEPPLRYASTGTVF